jgi:hypothetical protein
MNMMSSVEKLENGHSMNQITRIRRRASMTRQAKLETTLGDLVVALTEETERYVPDEKMTYEVVAYILANFLNGSQGHSHPWH